MNFQAHPPHHPRPSFTIKIIMIFWLLLRQPMVITDQFCFHHSSLIRIHSSHQITIISNLIPFSLIIVIHIILLITTTNICKEYFTLLPRLIILTSITKSTILHSFDNSRCRPSLSMNEKYLLPSLSLRLILLYILYASFPI
ncbi:hypothetical protein BCR42DRAFT_206896 [Absidia repens]|uniref:Uncharacterized protein n=1 Tax=Absidia repens TaxID=90262 RepID=A0A1X2IQ32_9FUNG|nr:hypothetical protein BCR42DRAFT_206896 [Absidia repens]